MGVAVFTVIACIVGLMALAGMLALSGGEPHIDDGSVMALHLSGTVEERASQSLFGEIGNASEVVVGLDDILSAIKRAKDDDRIRGIYIEAGMFSAGDPATAQAIRKQLADFKESGKWIVAYADSYTQTTYYICSVADKLWLNPQGIINWQGMAAQPLFLKGLLEKMGVRVQLVKVGKYKSAPETLTADKMSDANREQVAAYVTGIWQTMVDDVALSRHLSAAALNAYADSMVTFADPGRYVALGMVDSLMYTTEVKVEMRRMMGLDADADIPQVSMSEMCSLSQPEESGGKVAVYYAYGDVVDARTGNIMSDEACIDAQAMTCDLEALRDDDEVKAVVIRVNSGGGSAYASEQIWHAVSLLQEVKPVVVSMGGYAASGAYYLSCASDVIYAEPTTITGSIGIFGMFPDASQLLRDKLGIGFDAVKTNRHSDFGTLSRPFNDEERAYLEAYIDRGYTLFRQRVADGRHMSVDSVEQIAQGRVWLASDAVGIGLVDSLGGLDDAVAKAAQLANIEEWHTESYPEPADWMDLLFEEASGDHGNYLDSQLRSTLGDLYWPLRTAIEYDGRVAVQAMLPYRVTMR